MPATAATYTIHPVPKPVLLPYPTLYISAEPILIVPSSITPHKPDLTVIIAQNDGLGDLYSVLPLSSCAFSVCRNYTHFPHE